MSGDTNRMPSLLEEIDDAGSIGVRGPRKGGVRERLQRLDARLRAFAVTLWTNPRRRMVAAPVAGVLLATACVGTWLAVRHRPPPDYKTARIDLVFDYTLLTDDFNRLPVRERQRLLRELVQRVGDMNGQESGMLAAFAAGIYGKARDQIEENVSRLMLDTADEHAIRYSRLSPEERGEYLDQAVLDLMRTVEAIGGRNDERPDSERLAEAKTQAQRDAQFLQSGRMSAQAAGTMFVVLERGIGEHASAHQKARVSTMLRDMTDHLRGTGGPR